MIKLFLEYNLAILELPNPDFNNTVAVDAELSTKRSMDGTFYSYKKGSQSRFRITLGFSNIGFGRTKSTSDFFRAFAGQQFFLVDQDNITWKVRFNQSEFQFTVDRRAGPEEGSERSESCSFQLEFVGKKI